MRMKNFGLHVHRFRENPEEKRFAEAWEDANVNGQTLNHLMDRRSVHQGSPPVASDIERTAAATVVQWLGSPVGQIWLRELGYVRTVLLPGDSKEANRG